MDEAEEVIEIGEGFACDCCGEDESPSKLYDAPYRPGRPAGTAKDRLCIVCASTFIGNAWQYPQQHADVSLFQSLAQCTHLVLKAIKAQRMAEIPSAAKAGSVEREDGGAEAPPLQSGDDTHCV